MKICQLLHSMTTGGAEVLADRIARAFHDEHELMFACLDEVGELGERLRADGFVVHELHRQEGIDTGCMRRLGRFVKSQRVDVIHAHQYTPFFYAAGSRFFGPNRPIIFTEHGRFFPDLPSRKRAIFNRLLLRRHDHVIAVGNHVKQALVDNESIPAKRIDVIYNGIHLKPLLENHREQGRKKLRDELGIPTDAIVVAQVARLDSIKDHVSAIRSIHKLVETHPRVHFAIVGDGPERGRIEAEIQQLGVQTRVHLLGLRRDVPDILQGTDMVLLTSLSEGIPLSLIEGMAAGLPCVATDVGGVREVVSEHDSILCPSGDVDAISQAIARFAGDANLRAEMGAAGREVACGRFSEQAMFDQYADLFRKLSR